MAKTILTCSLIVLLSVAVGCTSVDSGRAQLLPVDVKKNSAAFAQGPAFTAGESDLVEQVAVSRQAYRNALQFLSQYYSKSGNNMKLVWVQRELTAMDKMPQYKYIVEAGLAGAELRAIASIPEADQLYHQAQMLEKKAKGFIIFPDSDLLRLALDKYNELIRKYPTSDKIDDAAYKAAGIYEHFKDFSIAVLYFQRAYQWDAYTPNPARFRAAFILDQKLRRRADALDIYREAVKQESGYESWAEYAEKRIRQLTGSEIRLKD